MRKTMKKTTMMKAAACLACVAVAAAAPNDAATCEAMAEKLNQRFIVGSNRFNTTSTGQEARDELREWMASNGLLVSMCNPQGYPDVYGPCADEVGMDHISASWIGQTDRTKELVEADILSPLQLYPGTIGLVFNISNPDTEVLCVSPSDSASDARQPDAKGNPACGSFNKPVTESLRMIEEYLRSVKEGDKPNATLELAVSEWEKYYYLGDPSKNVTGVSGWDQMKWWEGDNVTSDANVTCSDLYWTSTDPGEKQWAAIKPLVPMEEYLADPKNVWDPTKTQWGSFPVYYNAGTWNMTSYEELLGHPLCVDDSDPCVMDGTCTEGGKIVEWLADPLEPQHFQQAMDMQVELYGKRIPGLPEGKASLPQWNEISVSKNANVKGGVEAIFVRKDFFGPGGTLELLEKQRGSGASTGPVPPRAKEFTEYGARQLAEGYYGGIPVVYASRKKEDVLAGKVFGCSPDP